MQPVNAFKLSTCHTFNHASAFHSENSLITEERKNTVDEVECLRKQRVAMSARSQHFE